MKKLLMGGVAVLCLSVWGCGQPPAGTTTSAPSVVSTVNNITAQGAQDVQTLAGSMPAIEAALQATGKLSAAQGSQIQGDVSKAVTAAQTLVGMPQIPTNAPALQTFEAAVNDALAIAAVVAPAVPEVQATEVIVPLIEVGANLIVPQVQTLVAPGAGMTPDQARAVLRAARR